MKTWVKEKFLKTKFFGKYSSFTIQKVQCQRKDKFE